MTLNEFKKKIDKLIEDGFGDLSVYSSPLIESDGFSGIRFVGVDRADNGIKFVHCSFNEIGRRIKK